MARYLVLYLGLALILFVALGVVTWLAGIVPIFYLMFGISASWGISWDRAKGRLGILAGILWGAIGSALGAYFVAAMDPSFPGLLQGFAYPIMAFGGAIYGAILAAIVAILAVLIQNRPSHTSTRDLPRPKEAARLATLAFAVIWVFGGVLVAGQSFNFDLRRHLRPAITLKGYKGHVSSGSFASDSRTMATVDLDGTIRLWDLTTGSVAKQMQGSRWHNFAPVAFSPDGNSLASGGEDQIIRIWDTSTSQLRAKLVGHQGDISCLVFSPDGRKLFVASGTFTEDGQIKIWNLESQRELASLTKARLTKAHKDAVRSLSISPDGKMLAVPVSGLSTVQLLDGDTLAELSTLKGHRAKVDAVAFSPDGKILASGGGERDLQSEIFLWDVATGKKISEMCGHGRGITGLVFSPDGLLLASASEGDTTIWLWDTTAGQRRLVLKGLWGDGYPPVTGLAFSPDGRRLCGSDNKGTVIIWA